MTVERDAAGNTWATAPGADERFVIVGGHLDSVPNGGWLDGALNVVAGLEVLRALAPEERPFTLKLVDWADEEGARFGRSLLGSSAAAGTLDPEAVRGLTDRDGTALPDALAAHGVDLDTMRDAGRRARGRARLPRAAHRAGPGARAARHAARRGARHVRRPAPQGRFTGAHAHAGASPMHLRQRRVPRRRAQRAGVARRRRGARRRARHDRRREGHAGDRDRVQRDLRGLARPALRSTPTCSPTCSPRAREASERIAAEEGCTVAWERIWEIEPIPFDAGLIDLADAAIQDVAGTSDAAAERARCTTPPRWRASCRP